MNLSPVTDYERNITLDLVLEKSPASSKDIVSCMVAKGVIDNRARFVVRCLIDLGLLTTDKNFRLLIKKEKT